MNKNYTPLVNDRDIKIRLKWLDDTESIYTNIDRVPSVEGNMEFLEQEFGRWHVFIPKLKTLTVIYD
jgi:hypothetical protein